MVIQFFFECIGYLFYILFCFAYPFNETLHIIQIGCQKSAADHYRDYIQWGAYWSILGITMLIFGALQIILPEIILNPITHLKYLFLILLAHPKIHGAELLYREIINDPLRIYFLKNYFKQMKQKWDKSREKRRQRKSHKNNIINDKLNFSTTNNSAHTNLSSRPKLQIIDNFYHIDATIDDKNK